MEDDLYNNTMRSPERMGVPGRPPRHSSFEVEAEAPPYHSSSRRRRRDEQPKMSELAGLRGFGRGMSRVDEWRLYVEPGAPDDESATTVAA